MDSTSNRNTGYTTVMDYIYPIDTSRRLYPLSSFKSILTVLYNYNHNDYSFVAVAPSSLRINTLNKDISENNYSSFKGVQPLILLFKLFNLGNIYIDNACVVNPNSNNKLLYLCVTKINRVNIKKLLDNINLIDSMSYDNINRNSFDDNGKLKNITNIKLISIIDIESSKYYDEINVNLDNTRMLFSRFIINVFGSDISYPVYDFCSAIHKHIRLIK